MDRFMDINVIVKEHKTISNVMTVNMAIKAGKSSKNHKLQIRRSDKMDRTKSKDQKSFTKDMKQQRMLKMA
jgi:hypothetical protein